MVGSRSWSRERTDRTSASLTHTCDDPLNAWSRGELLGRRIDTARSSGDAVYNRRPSREAPPGVGMLTGDMLRRSAQRFPNKVAIIRDDVRLTYSELEASANQF